MPVDEWRRVIFPADEDAAVAIAFKRSGLGREQGREELN
jgi:hypothetical protein